MCATVRIKLDCTDPEMQKSEQDDIINQRDAEYKQKMKEQREGRKTRESRILLGDYALYPDFCNTAEGVVLLYFAQLGRKGLCKVLQGRSQIFTTDEASVPRAKCESFLGPGLGACPGNIFKSNSSKIVFSAFFQWIFLSKIKLVQV